MILRRVARPLLAASFIYGGLNSIRNAEGHAQVVKPFLDKTVGAQADALPDAVPTDPVSLVKLDGAVKIVAGSALALGKMPRLSALALIGSLVPTTLAGHAFWEKQDPAERKQHLIQVIKNGGLAGGLLMVASEGKGKPTGRQARKAERKADKKADKKATKKAAKQSAKERR